MINRDPGHSYYFLLRGTRTGDRGTPTRIEWYSVLLCFGKGVGHIYVWIVEDFRRRERGLDSFTYIEDEILNYPLFPRRL